MHYFYHAVPTDLEGSFLMPLTDLHTRRPDLHKKYVEKYNGREEVMDRKIPLLNCLWNDVVQLLPMHPQKVFELQVELGLIPEVPSYELFQIDPQDLDPDKTVIFFKTAPGEENTDFKWVEDVDLDDLQNIPRATINYYKSLIGTGELPFNYQFIPHVLYKGPIDISTSDRITLKPNSKSQ